MMARLVPATQADREAAASGYYAWIGGNPTIPRKMLAGEADDHSMVQAFARHRLSATYGMVSCALGLATPTPALTSRGEK